MQTNNTTTKIIKRNKQEGLQEVLKRAHKGKTWKRKTDKREMYNYALESR